MGQRPINIKDPLLVLVDSENSDVKLFVVKIVKLIRINVVHISLGADVMILDLFLDLSQKLRIALKKPSDSVSSLCKSVAVIGEP